MAEMASRVSSGVSRVEQVQGTAADASPRPSSRTEAKYQSGWFSSNNDFRISLGRSVACLDPEFLALYRQL